ncbi:hypothetical protein [Actinomadura spongiicola]|uniref:hypothetical protein n=1 Tax=Actinomadura spongiicola TaxID=2303421 RepID=UPI001F3E8F71|nr:hypothetical protein [Actinomadura spongiicola]
MSVLRRLLRFRTVPRRVQGVTALVLLAVVALFSVTGAAVWDARAALRAIGHNEGPMVVATNDVYLALSDMDAQVTNVLLTGGEEGWLCDTEQVEEACTRSLPRYFYDIRREDAQRAVLQAARLAQDDPVGLRTVQSVLDGLSQYDQRVQAAMERSAETPHTFGGLPPAAVKEYRAATRIMTEDLLPKANNLMLDGAAAVEESYGDPLSNVRSGRAWVLALGLTVLVTLGLLQVYIARRFRRIISLFLVGAALVTTVVTVSAASLLATEADYLRMAKDDGFDPVLRLSRTRAIGKSLDADRTRALLDPADADRYDQTYFEKSQTILYIRQATNLESYYTMLNDRVGRYGADGQQVTFKGLYGVAAAEAAARGRRESVDSLVARFRDYQEHDRHVRTLARGGDRQTAAEAHMDPRWRYLPHPTFREHDAGLGALVDRRQLVVDHTVRSGERALRPWPWLLPVSGLAIAALVVAGVWPRLAEYR